MDLNKWIAYPLILLRAEQNYGRTIWWGNFDFSLETGVVHRLCLDLSRMLIVTVFASFTLWTWKF